MRKNILLISLLSLCLVLTACKSGETAQNGSAPAVAIQLSEGEEKYIENETYEGDVTISGDNAQIAFVGCTFKGNLINTAEQGTRVMLLENSVVNGECIFQNNTKESNVDASFPKFIADAPINVRCQDCFGTVAVAGDFEITFNGETYAMEDSEYLYDGEFIPYDGQDASAFFVAQWWENGEKIVLIACEY